MAHMRQIDRPVTRVIIAGGGNIGLRLARALEGRLNVKVIESSKRRCEYLSGQLGSTLVLNGDVSNEELIVTGRFQRINVGDLSEVEST